MSQGAFFPAVAWLSWGMAFSLFVDASRSDVSADDSPFCAGRAVSDEKEVPRLNESPWILIFLVLMFSIRVIAAAFAVIFTCLLPTARWLEASMVIGFSLMPATSAIFFLRGLGAN